MTELFNDSFKNPFPFQENYSFSNNYKNDFIVYYSGYLANELLKLNLSNNNINEIITQKVLEYRNFELLFENLDNNFDYDDFKNIEIITNLIFDAYRFFNEIRFKKIISNYEEDRLRLINYLNNLNFLNNNKHFNFFNKNQILNNFKNNRIVSNFSAIIDNNFIKYFNTNINYLYFNNFDLNYLKHFSSDNNLDIIENTTNNNYEISTNSEEIIESFYDDKLYQSLIISVNINLNIPKDNDFSFEFDNILLKYEFINDNIDKFNVVINNNKVFINRIDNATNVENLSIDLFFSLIPNVNTNRKYEITENKKSYNEIITNPIFYSLNLKNINLNYLLNNNSYIYYSPFRRLDNLEKLNIIARTDFNKNNNIDYFLNHYVFFSNNNRLLKIYEYFDNKIFDIIDNRFGLQVGTTYVYTLDFLVSVGTAIPGENNINIRRIDIDRFTDTESEDNIKYIYVKKDNNYYISNIVIESPQSEGYLIYYDKETDYDINFHTNTLETNILKYFNPISVFSKNNLKNTNLIHTEDQIENKFSLRDTIPTEIKDVSIYNNKTLKYDYYDEVFISEVLPYEIFKKIQDNPLQITLDYNSYELVDNTMIVNNSYQLENLVYINKNLISEKNNLFYFNKQSSKYYIKLNKLNTDELIINDLKIINGKILNEDYENSITYNNGKLLISLEDDNAEIDYDNNLSHILFNNATNIELISISKNPIEINLVKEYSTFSELTENLFCYKLDNLCEITQNIVNSETVLDFAVIRGDVLKFSHFDIFINNEKIIDRTKYYEFIDLNINDNDKTYTYQNNMITFDFNINNDDEIKINYYSLPDRYSLNLEALNVSRLYRRNNNNLPIVKNSTLNFIE